MASAVLIKRHNDASLSTRVVHVGMIYLGWANDWCDTPEIVLKCREMEHAGQGLTESYEDNVKCIGIYSCKACGYSYKVDSGD